MVVNPFPKCTQCGEQIRPLDHVIDETGTYLGEAAANVPTELEEDGALHVDCDHPTNPQE